MHKILISIDYSPSAQIVAELGNQIATSLQAEVHLLHVVNSINYYLVNDYSPIMGFSGFLYNTTTMPNVAEYITSTAYEFLLKTKEHLHNADMHAIVKDGNTADVILETVKDIKATMIIMGSHSKQWLEQMLLGSTTHKVLHHSSIPVLIIPVNKIM